MKKQILTLTMIGAVAMVLTSACGGSSSSATTTSATDTLTTTTTTATSAPAEKHLATSDLVKKDFSTDGLDVTMLAPSDARLIWTTDKKQAFVYGGKFFKITVMKDSAGNAKSNYDFAIYIDTTKDGNPDAVKLLESDALGYLKQKKDSTLDFNVFVQRKPRGSYFILSGIPYDYSPDKSTAYTAADIRTMYAAARSITPTK